MPLSARVWQGTSQVSEFENPIKMIDAGMELNRRWWRNTMQSKRGRTNACTKNHHDGRVQMPSGTLSRAEKPSSTTREIELVESSNKSRFTGPVPYPVQYPRRPDMSSVMIRVTEVTGTRDRAWLLINIELHSRRARQEEKRDEQ